MSLVCYAQQCVARGAALLASRDPRWFTKVNTATLDVTDGDNCVLTQVYGKWQDGMKVLGLTDEQDPAIHGFYTHPHAPEWHERYVALTRAWKEHIEMLREREYSAPLAAPGVALKMAA